jgi:hypothetical protein
MPAHRLLYRLPPQYAPMTPIAHWQSRIGSPPWPAIPVTRPSRTQTTALPHCYHCDKAFGFEVTWMFRPVRGSTHQSTSGPFLVHSTYIAGDDEQQIGMVEAAMGVSLRELVRRRLQRRHR